MEDGFLYAQVYGRTKGRVVRVWVASQWSVLATCVRTEL